MNMAESKSKWEKALMLLPFGLFAGLGLLIGGLTCLNTQHTNTTTFNETCRSPPKTYKYVKEDSVIIGDVSHCESTTESFTCDKSPLNSLPCECALEMNLTHDIEGDVVIAYELNQFNDTVGKDPKIYNSRDNRQLGGVLSGTVSPSCQPPYDKAPDGRPIAPCGQLADVMFNDTITYIIVESSGDKLKSSYLLHNTQKNGFRNPESENLTDAFQNFSKPISWSKSIWELDPQDIGNNGFQNEAFIVWMRTDLPVKPMWRLDRSGKFARGLPKGVYIIHYEYNYPFSVYNGQRTLSVYVEELVPAFDCVNSTIIVSQEIFNYGVGVTGIVLGVILLVVCAAILIAFKVITAINIKRKNTDELKSSDTETIQPQSAPAASQLPEGGDRDDTQHVKLIEKPEKIVEKPNKTPVIQEEQEPLKEDYL